MDLFDEMFGLTSAFNAAQIPYAVAGGMAVAIHGYPRFTKDIDLLILPRDEARAMSVAAERMFVFDGGRLPMGGGEPVEREIVRVSKIEGKVIVTLDLMIVNQSILPAWDSRIDFDLQDHRVTVVSRDGLKLLKKLAGRKQDFLDLEQLGLDYADETDAV